MGINSQRRPCKVRHLSALKLYNVYMVKEDVSKQTLHFALEGSRCINRDSLDQDQWHTIYTSELVAADVDIVWETPLLSDPQHARQCTNPINSQPAESTVPTYDATLKDLDWDSLRITVYHAKREHLAGRQGSVSATNPVGPATAVVSTCAGNATSCLAHHPETFPGDFDNRHDHQAWQDDQGIRGRASSCRSDSLNQPGQLNFNIQSDATQSDSCDRVAVSDSFLDHTLEAVSLKLALDANENLTLHLTYRSPTDLNACQSCQNSKPGANTVANIGISDEQPSGVDERVQVVFCVNEEANHEQCLLRLQIHVPVQAPLNPIASQLGSHSSSGSEASNDSSCRLTQHAQHPDQHCEVIHNEDAFSEHSSSGAQGGTPCQAAQESHSQHVTDRCIASNSTDGIQGGMQASVDRVSYHDVFGPVQQRSLLLQVSFRTCDLVSIDAPAMRRIAHGVNQVLLQTRQGLTLVPSMLLSVRGLTYIPPPAVLQHVALAPFSILETNDVSGVSGIPGAGNATSDAVLPAGKYDSMLTQMYGRAGASAIPSDPQYIVNQQLARWMLDGGSVIAPLEAEHSLDMDAASQLGTAVINTNEGVVRRGTQPSTGVISLPARSGDQGRSSTTSLASLVDQAAKGFADATSAGFMPAMAAMLFGPAAAVVAPPRQPAASHVPSISSTQPAAVRVFPPTSTTPRYDGGVSKSSATSNSNSLSSTSASRRQHQGPLQRSETPELSSISSPAGDAHAASMHRRAASASGPTALTKTSDLVKDFHVQSTSTSGYVTVGSAAVKSGVTGGSSVSNPDPGTHHSGVHQHVFSPSFRPQVSTTPAQGKMVHNITKESGYSLATASVAAGKVSDSVCSPASVSVSGTTRSSFTITRPANVNMGSVQEEDNSECREYTVEDMSSSTRRLLAVHSRLTAIQEAKRKAEAHVLQLLADSATSQQQQLRLKTSRLEVATLRQRHQEAEVKLARHRVKNNQEVDKLQVKVRRLKEASQALQAARQRLHIAQGALSGPEGWGLWRTLHAHATGRANFLVARTAAVYELGPRGHPLSVTNPHLFCAHHEALAKPKLTAGSLLTNAVVTGQTRNSQLLATGDLIQLDVQGPMKPGVKHQNDLKRASMNSNSKPPLPGHTRSTSFNLINLDSPRLTGQPSVKHDVDGRSRSSMRSIDSSRRKQPPTTTPSSVLEEILATQPLDQVMDVSWFAAGASPAAESAADDESLSATPHSLSRGSSFNSHDSSIDLDDVIMRALQSGNSEGVASATDTSLFKPTNPASTTALPSVPSRASGNHAALPPATQHVAHGTASGSTALATPTASKPAVGDLLSFRPSYPGLAASGEASTSHVQASWSKPSGVSRRSSWEGGSRVTGGMGGQGELPLCICGLQIPTDIILRNMNGTAGTGGPDEDQRMAAALGYVAHMVDRIAMYLEVPLRYPIRAAMSRSHMYDPWPTDLPDFNANQGLLQKGLDMLMSSFTSTTTPTDKTSSSATTILDTSFGSAAQWLLGNKPTGLLTGNLGPTSPQPNSKAGTGVASIKDLFGVARTKATNKDVDGSSQGMMFPLYVESSRDRPKFAYAVHLLSKDVEQIMQAHGLQSAGPTHLLKNLYQLALVAASAVPMS